MPSSARWRGYIGSFCYVDGTAHLDIMRRGYLDDSPPSVARFPGYPLVGSILHSATGLPAELVLVLLSNLSLMGSFVIMHRYVALRCPDKPPQFPGVVLVLLGVWPSTFFLRMAYTESVFLFCALLSMYAMERRWCSSLIAMIVGLTTAMRPVGVALVAVFAYYLWQEFQRTKCAQAEIAGDRLGWLSVLRFAGRASVWLIVACWGVGAYMIYLHIEFGDPLAFATAHKFWWYRPTPWPEKIAPLLTLEPLWSPYVPGNAVFWRNFQPAHLPIVNFGFVNPFVFALSAGLVAVGTVKRWLNGREVSLCTLLVFVPYVMMGYDNIMLAQPRFLSVVFPLYIISARLLWAVPSWARIGFFIVCACLLAMYSAYFGAAYGNVYKILN